MGFDKALLPCSTEEPLWSRQLNLLRTLQAQYSWISARSVPAWCPTGIEVILDVPPSRGPLSGICACLGRLETTHLVALAVDMPRMTIEHLHRLREFAQAGRSVIPVNDDHFEPLCAVYCKSCESLAAEFLSSSDSSLQTFAERLVDENLATPYSLSADEKSLYFNVNRPEDFSRL